jgi:hypothetical protein
VYQEKQFLKTEIMEGRRRKYDPSLFQKKAADLKLPMIYDKKQN